MSVERDTADGQNRGADGVRGVVPIQSVERAAMFLGLFSAADPELSLGEITTRLGMSRPTAHRYGMSLRSVGLVRYDPAGGTYSLGPRIIELGRIALANLSIVKLAEPALERLSEKSNETVVMSIWDGEAPVLVHLVDRTDRLVSVAVRVGSRLPPFTSAQGQLYLAYSESAREVHRRNRQLARLEKQLDEVRSAGISISDGVIPGITVVAAPIFQGHDELAATVALVCHQASGVASPGSPAVADLRAAAAEILQLVGTQPT